MHALAVNVDTGSPRYGKRYIKECMGNGTIQPKRGLLVGDNGFDLLEDMFVLRPPRLDSNC